MYLGRLYAYPYATIGVAVGREAMIMRLTFDEYQATVERVAKINLRAVRRGWTGRLTVTAEEITETRKDDLGFEITEHFWDTTIGGDAPSYNGFRLLATLAWDSESGLITRTAPGVDTIDRSGLREGWCDHCKINRHRNDTFLVRNEETGEQHQVGSTCIKDFLGWHANPVFLDSQSVTEEVGAGGGFGGERRWSVETILAVSWAVVQAFGFHKADGYSGTPTKYTVLDVLDPHGESARNLARDLAPYVEQAAGQAKLIREFLLSDRFAGGGEYVANLKAVARAESASARNIGLLASAPQAWARAMEREVRREQEKAQLVNEFYPAADGTKIKVSVAVKSIRYLENAYGTTTVYTLVTDDGYVLLWYASRSALGDESDGTVFTLQATVKGQDEWNGYKRTKITRAKVLAQTAGGGGGQ